MKDLMEGLRALEAAELNEYCLTFFPAPTAAELAEFERTGKRKEEPEPVWHCHVDAPALHMALARASLEGAAQGISLKGTVVEARVIMDMPDAMAEMGATVAGLLAVLGAGKPPEAPPADPAAPAPGPHLH
jgi:hypothetical protein